MKSAAKPPASKFVEDSYESASADESAAATEKKKRKNKAQRRKAAAIKKANNPSEKPDESANKPEAVKRVLISPEDEAAGWSVAQPRAKPETEGGPLGGSESDE